MPRKNVSLENSAYARLRGAKRSGESFTDVINRLTPAAKPSFSIFAGLLDEKAGAALEKAFATMRAVDLGSAPRRLRRSPRSTK